MKSMISVVIPCYNAEKYIRRCLDSILSQTYSNLEIILVDDASSDDTSKIIKEYASKNKNIQFLQNKENKGAAFSRNLGLSVATNDLISFVDADDYLQSNFYEVLLQKMMEENSDVVVCDILTKYDDVSGMDTRNVVFCGKKNKDGFINNGLAASPCNKLFHKKDLLKYPFPEGMMNEDIPVVLPILLHAKHISYSEDTCYYYVQQKSSVQNSHLSDKRLDLFLALDVLEDRYPRNQENEFYWSMILFNQVILFFFYYLIQEDNAKVRKKYLQKYHDLTKKYNLLSNPFLQDFYSQQGAKHRYFYKTIFEFTMRGFYTLSNGVLSVYHFYLKNKKSVFKESITMDDLVLAAEVQSKIPESSIHLSVVVPNYNYEKYLLQRIYSILSQTKKVHEIILLDDCSTDDSRKLIDEIEKVIGKYVPIKKVYNKENSGTAFKQWKKGFHEASGDYVWIAEADDYCDCEFLANVLKPIETHPGVVLSYSDTSFVDKDGFVIMKTVKNEIDLLKTGHWDHDFIHDGKEEIQQYAYLNCTIANVSSVVFKKEDYDFELATQYKQTGGWIFYLGVMSHGEVAYCRKRLNYYRLHGANVTSTTKKENHLKEIQRVHQYIDEEYGLDAEQKKNIQDRYQFLRKVWSLESGGENEK